MGIYYLLDEQDFIIDKYIKPILKASCISITWNFCINITYRETLQKFKGKLFKIEKKLLSKYCKKHSKQEFSHF